MAEGEALRINKNAANSYASRATEAQTLFNFTLFAANVSQLGFVIRYWNDLHENYQGVLIAILGVTFALHMCIFVFLVAVRFLDLRSGKDRPREEAPRETRYDEKKPLGQHPAWQRSSPSLLLDPLEIKARPVVTVPLTTEDVSGLVYGAPISAKLMRVLVDILRSNYLANFVPQKQIIVIPRSDLANDLHLKELDSTTDVLALLETSNSGWMVAHATYRRGPPVTKNLTFVHSLDAPKQAPALVTTSALDLLAPMSFLPEGSRRKRARAAVKGYCEKLRFKVIDVDKTDEQQGWNVYLKALEGTPLANTYKSVVELRNRLAEIMADDNFSKFLSELPFHPYRGKKLWTDRINNLRADGKNTKCWPAAEDTHVAFANLLQKAFIVFQYSSANDIEIMHYPCDSQERDDENCAAAYALWVGGDEYAFVEKLPKVDPVTIASTSLSLDQRRNQSEIERLLKRSGLWEDWRVPLPAAHIIPYPSLVADSGICALMYAMRVLDTERRVVLSEPPHAEEIQNWRLTFAKALTLATAQVDSVSQPPPGGGKALDTALPTPPPRSPAPRRSAVPSVVAGWDGLDAQLQALYNCKSMDVGGYPDCFYFCILYWLKKTNLTKLAPDVQALRQALHDELATQLPTDADVLTDILEEVNRAQPGLNIKTREQYLAAQRNGKLYGGDVETGALVSWFHSQKLQLRIRVFTQDMKNPSRVDPQDHGDSASNAPHWDLAHVGSHYRVVVPLPSRSATPPPSSTPTSSTTTAGSPPPAQNSANNGGGVASSSSSPTASTPATVNSHTLLLTPVPPTTNPAPPAPAPSSASNNPTTPATNSTGSLSQESAVLVVGMGGGMDVLAAYFIGCILKDSGVKKVELGAIYDNKSGEEICDTLQNLLLKDETYIWILHRFSYKDRDDLSRQLVAACKKKYDHVVFVDVGGDSLVVLQEDLPYYPPKKYQKGPNSGTDADACYAIEGLTAADVNVTTYIAVVAAGVDITEPAWKSRIEQFRGKNAYWGALDLKHPHVAVWFPEWQLNVKAQTRLAFINLAKSLLKGFQTDKDIGFFSRACEIFVLSLESDNPEAHFTSKGILNGWIYPDPVKESYRDLYASYCLSTLVAHPFKSHLFGGSALKGISDQVKAKAAAATSAAKAAAHKQQNPDAGEASEGTPLLGKLKAKFNFSNSKISAPLSRRPLKSRQRPSSCCSCMSGSIRTNSPLRIVILFLIAFQLALNAALSTFLAIGLPANLNITSSTNFSELPLDSLMPAPTFSPPSPQPTSVTPVSAPFLPTAFLTTPPAVTNGVIHLGDVRTFTIVGAVGIVAIIVGYAVFFRLKVAARADRKL